MKKACLNVIAKLAKNSIKTSNGSRCIGLSYQPKAPEGIKNFK